MKSSLCTFTKQRIFDILSIIITLFCIGFVIYKGEECFAKFIEKPKSTDVTIEHSHKHPYPAISICNHNFYEDYNDTLNKCNLTSSEYYDENTESYKWVGSGSEVYCSDPAKLYRSMTKDRFSILRDVWTADDNDEIFAKDEDFHFKDSLWNGRCYTYEAPHKEEMIVWKGWIHKKAHIFIHTPGSFFGSDYKEFLWPINQDITVDLMHEVFKVLEFDGENCEDYVYGRDDCIHKIVHEISMKEIGCTTPFGLNKTSICTNREDAINAINLFLDMTYFNQTKANLYCPKSCTYMMTSFSSFTKETKPKNGPGYLELRFQRFIKVSRSRVAYGWLELLAEVGGYVGLFLGVSINQISSLSKSFFTRIKNIIDE